VNHKQERQETEQQKEEKALKAQYVKIEPLMWRPFEELLEKLQNGR